MTHLRISFRPLPSGKVAAMIAWRPGDRNGLPQMFVLRVKVNGQDRVKNKAVSGTRVTVGNIPKRDFHNRASKVLAFVVAGNTQYYGPGTVTKEAYVPQ